MLSPTAVFRGDRLSSSSDTPLFFHFSIFTLTATPFESIFDAGSLRLRAMAFAVRHLHFAAFSFL
jgi:hypothetical protein